jgi:Oligoketide cyclase/lipid transport protein
MIPSIFLSKTASHPIRHRHVVKKILDTSPQHLYNIVIDVDSYRDFLPFCKSSRILRRSNCGEMFDASLKIGVSDIPPLNALEEEYISRVRHVQLVSPLDGRNEWIVEAKSIKSNLFHGLSSCWKLTQINTEDIEMKHSYPLSHPKDDPKRDGTVNIYTTKVEFEVEISVLDPFISTALDQVLEGVALQQMEAFEKRCKLVPEYHT